MEPSNLDRLIAADPQKVINIIADIVTLLKNHPEILELIIKIFGIAKPVDLSSK